MTDRISLSYNGRTRGTLPPSSFFIPSFFRAPSTRRQIQNHKFTDYAISNSFINYVGTIFYYDSLFIVSSFRDDTAAILSVIIARKFKTQAKIILRKKRRAPKNTRAKILVISLVRFASDIYARRRRRIIDNVLQSQRFYPNRDMTYIFIYIVGSWTFDMSTGISDKSVGSFDARLVTSRQWRAHKAHSTA